MKRNLIMFGIIFLILVSIAYARVLSYYGMIEAQVKVVCGNFNGTHYQCLSGEWVEDCSICLGG